MNEDLKELLRFLRSHHVEFVVIGAHAVAFHGRPRFTEDLDLFIGRSIENVERLGKALSEFGAGIGQQGVFKFSSDDRQMVRLGVPPAMVDLLNFAGSKPFEEVWESRALGSLDGVEVFFPSLNDLIDMKESAGRPQDKADIDTLKNIRDSRK